VEDGFYADFNAQLQYIIISG